MKVVKLTLGTALPEFPDLTGQPVSGVGKHDGILISWTSPGIVGAGDGLDGFGELGW